MADMDQVASSDPRDDQEANQAIEDNLLAQASSEQPSDQASAGSESVAPEVVVPAASTLQGDDSSDDTEDTHSKDVPPPVQEAKNDTPTDESKTPQKQPLDPNLSQAIDRTITNPQVQQYLKDKYGFSSDLDDSALKAAQDKALGLQKQNMFGRGLDLAGFGFAQLGAGNKFNELTDDQKLFDQSSKLAQQPVENILARRKGIMENEALNQDQLKTQGLQDTIQQQLSLNDPNSQESQIAQKAYLPILQKAGLDTSLLKGASAGVIQKVLQQPLEFADKQKQQELLAQSNHDLKQLQLQGVQAQREFNNQFKANNFQDSAYKQLGSQYENATKKSQEGLNQFNAIDASLEDAYKNKNRAAAALIAPELARAIISSRPTAPEIQAAGGSQAFLDKANALASQIQSGGITPQNYDYFKQLINSQKGNIQNQLDETGQNFASKAATRLNADPAEAFQKITGRKLPDKLSNKTARPASSNPSQGQPNVPPASTGSSAGGGSTPSSVQILTSDGQHLSIPKDSLAEAQKRDPNLQVLQ